MLVCEQCGCSGELGMGWLHVVRIDVEETEDAGVLVEYCPTCAEVVFGSEGGGVREPTAPETKRGRVGARDIRTSDPWAMRGTTPPGPADLQ